MVCYCCISHTHAYNNKFWIYIHIIEPPSLILPIFPFYVTVFLSYSFIRLPWFFEFHFMVLVFDAEPSCFIPSFLNSSFLHSIVDLLALSFRFVSFILSYGLICSLAIQMLGCVCALYPFSVVYQWTGCVEVSDIVNMYIYTDDNNINAHILTAVSLCTQNKRVQYWKREAQACLT